MGICELLLDPSINLRYQEQKFVNSHSMRETHTPVFWQGKGPQLQFLRETQVGLAGNEASAQAESERRESEWGIEDLDQEEGE